MPFDAPAQVSSCEPDAGTFVFCNACALARACEGRNLKLAARRKLQDMVRRLGPFAPGSLLFRQGDPFLSITAVHSGTVKTFVIDASGREQVLGFFQPGDVLGLDAIHTGRYPCHAMALDTVSLCSAPFPAMTELATEADNLQLQIFRLLSHDIRKAALLAGDHTADERVATFLMSLSRHRAARGEIRSELDLAMSRQDIANYLRLASETVSRVLQRLQQEGVIRVNRRRVELLDMARLEALALPLPAPALNPATAAEFPTGDGHALPSK